MFGFVLFGDFGDWFVDLIIGKKDVKALSGDSSTKSLADSFRKALSKSSTKPLAVRTMVSNAKFEVEKFDGMNNFDMWQCEVMDVLVQQSWILLWKTNLKGCQTRIGKRLIYKLVAPFVCVWPRMLILVVAWWLNLCTSSSVAWTCMVFAI